MRLYRLIWVYTCQNATLLEITCDSSFVYVNTKGSSVFEQFSRITSACCGYSKETFQWDCSFEHPKDIFKLMDKKIPTILRWNILVYGTCTYISSLWDGDRARRNISYGNTCLLWWTKQPSIRGGEWCLRTSVSLGATVTQIYHVRIQRQY